MQVKVGDEVSSSWGQPEDIVKAKESFTGRYLKPVLTRRPKPANNLTLQSACRPSPTAC
ncbi:hypothetical protein HYPDE_33888 [Hyphomicrobium denitrificans 1NES1]|uniref:Uncharacterized protein n=1 Tax=Hyphomicrobium denitrificans 1NES1 TaxID=670307 RepID=N0BEB0_9HYPH|nr:hypothetical protein HYPDE_33888 [Hyphomicrobium denitrificans 1NES1]